MFLYQFSDRNLVVIPTRSYLRYGLLEIRGISAAKDCRLIGIFQKIYTINMADQTNQNSAQGELCFFVWISLSDLIGIYIHFLEPTRSKFLALDLNNANCDRKRPSKKLSFQQSSVGSLPNRTPPLSDKTRDRIKMQATGKLQIAPGQIYDFTADDLLDEGEIGRGAFGAVNRMKFMRTDTVMAVKRIRSTVDEKEQKQLLMDLEVVMKSNDCNAIVTFYGALFKEGDCWICMELMDTSLDKFYKFICDCQHDRIPEPILCQITLATVRALNYLKEELEIIHRDVKPSNILLKRNGDIKLCDFGISGQLVDSIARTKDAGCRPYMAVASDFQVLR